MRTMVQAHTGKVHVAVITWADKTVNAACGFNVGVPGVGPPVVSTVGADTSWCAPCKRLRERYLSEYGSDLSALAPVIIREKDLPNYEEVVLFRRMTKSLAKAIEKRAREQNRELYDILVSDPPTK